MEPVVCGSCKQSVVPAPPSWLWMLFNVLFATVVLLIGAAFALLLVLNVVLLPLWMVFMAGGVAVTTRRAFMWRCPECHSEMLLTAMDKKRIRSGGAHRGQPQVFVPRHGG